ncbi:hypothetical protein AmDm5_2931 [Acetobacter malorum]|nr:hypothetical protein AmDm5_2931 [Acetobacter malorum]
MRLILFELSAPFACARVAVPYRPENTSFFHFILPAFSAFALIPRFCGWLRG